ETLLDRLKLRLGTLRLGDPLDKNTDIGAINSRDQLDKITGLAAAGEAEGAERWSPPCPLPAKGYWFPPTVFSGVRQSHRIARERRWPQPGSERWDGRRPGPPSKGTARPEPAGRAKPAGEGRKGSGGKPGASKATPARTSESKSHTSRASTHSRGPKGLSKRP